MTAHLVRMLLVVLVAAITTLLPAGCESRPANALPAVPESYLFCFWNVENFFDDRLDGRENKADKEFDTWFATDREALRLKPDYPEALRQLSNETRAPAQP